MEFNNTNCVKLLLRGGWVPMRKKKSGQFVYKLMGVAAQIEYV